MVTSLRCASAQKPPTPTHADALECLGSATVLPIKVSSFTNRLINVIKIGLKAAS